MKKLGVTGKMSSGKTTLCLRIMQNIGNCLYLSVDEIRRRLIAENQSLQMLLQKNFGTFNRSELSKIVFSSPQNINLYNSLIIPQVKKEIEKIASTSGADFLLLEWARLVEDDLLPLVGYNILVVSCPDAVILRRLSSSNLSENEIKQRLASQVDWQKKHEELEKLCRSHDGKALFIETVTGNSDIDWEKYFG